jgi:hypothetical protein
LETAKDRLLFLKGIMPDEGNVAFIFEAYYSSAVEALHALVLLRGFKVENHVCLGFYLRDVLKREDLFRVFDACRRDRNSLVYYGSRPEPGVAKRNVVRLERMIEEVEKLAGLGNH